MNNIHSDDFDLNLVPVFDAIYREKSVTRAADQLGVSQSNLSHSLRRLREFFNDPLFVRTGEGMTPTPRGQELSLPILGIMRSIRQELLTSINFDPLKSSRSFGICMTDMGELVFLPTLIEHFQKVAPNCSIRSVQIPPKNISAALESGEIDLAIGSLHAMPDGLFQQQIFTHPFVTIAHPKNRKIGNQISVEAFFEMEHITVALDGQTSEHYDSAIDLIGPKRKIRLTTPHFLTVPLIIEQNPSLIATVPRELGTIFSKLNAIKVIPTPVPIPRILLKQHWHPRFHYDEANTWLRKLVKSAFANYPE